MQTQTLEKKSSLKKKKGGGEGREGGREGGVECQKYIESNRECKHRCFKKASFKKGGREELRVRNTLKVTENVNTHALKKGSLKKGGGGGGGEGGREVGGGLELSVRNAVKVTKNVNTDAFQKKR